MRRRCSHRVRTYRDYVDTGVLFAAHAVAEGAHVLVNSRLAKEQIEADLALAGRTPPPISVVPHAVPAGAPASAVERDAEPLVVALGFVVARTQPELLLDAIARVSRPVRLVFVGSCAPALEDALVDRARRLNVALTITGYVDEVSYRDWIRRAWCAVQLREIDFGESTGTVHDAIAEGLPTITSVRSCRELPSGVVVNVAPSIEPSELAVEVERVLFDRDERSRMVVAAHSYSAAWTFRDVARRVEEVIDATVAPPSRPYLT